MSPWNVTIMHTCDVYACTRAALVNIESRIVLAPTAGWAWSIVETNGTRVVRVTTRPLYERRQRATYLCQHHAAELGVDPTLIEGALP